VLRFFFLFFIAIASASTFAERCQPLLASKLDNLNGFQPTFSNNGFEFLTSPLSISELEAQTLVDDIRRYFNERNLDLSHQNLPVLEGNLHLAVSNEFSYSPRLLDYLRNTRHPIYRKIHEQVLQIVQNPKKYLERGIPCEKIEVALRIGFKEAPLYKAFEISIETTYHQDILYTRILAPLLGSPTEVYCPILERRMDLPMRVATLITGNKLSKKNATWHRAQGIFDEDRVLLVLTCTSMTEWERSQFKF